MLVAIHQPHFVPWLGYLDRMVRADLFVILDHVQFERRNYQNRTHDPPRGRVASWLTVPVVQLSQKETIIEKQVDNPEDLGSRAGGAPTHFKTLKYAYRKSPYFDALRAAPAGDLRGALGQARRPEHGDARIPARGARRSPRRSCSSSHAAADGQRSELLLNICQEVGAERTFLGGIGGSRDYLNKAAFDEAGMGVVWQEFTHPVYPQCGDRPFIKGLVRRSTCCSTAARAPPSSCAQCAPPTPMSSSPPESKPRAGTRTRSARYGYDHRGLGFRNTLVAGEALRGAARSWATSTARACSTWAAASATSSHSSGARHRARLHRHRRVQADDRALPRALRRRPTRSSAWPTCWSSSPTRHYDYVVASGSSASTPRARASASARRCERMFGWSRIGMAANFLSTRSPAARGRRASTSIRRRRWRWASRSRRPRASTTRTCRTISRLYLYKTPAWQLDN